MCTLSVKISTHEDYSKGSNNTELREMETVSGFNDCQFAQPTLQIKSDCEAELIMLTSYPIILSPLIPSAQTTLISLLS